MTPQIKVLFEDVQIQLDAAKKSASAGFYATANAEINGAFLMLRNLAEELEIAPTKKM